MTLDDAIRDLEAALHKVRGDALHQIPDIILYNLGLDVLEQAKAVEQLLPSPFRRSAYANARAALESAIDSVYMTLDETTYDERGARARIFELFESERLQRRAEIVRTSIPGSSEAVEHAVREDVKLWNQASPGQGRLLITEWERYSRNPPAVGDHWSGHSRYDLYRQLMGTSAEGEELVRMLDVVYGVLSVAAHPRPRTGQRITTMPDSDTLVFEPNSSDATHLTEATVFAIKLTLHARQRRAGFAVVSNRGDG